MFAPFVIVSRAAAPLIVWLSIVVLLLVQSRALATEASPVEQRTDAAAAAVAAAATQQNQPHRSPADTITIDPHADLPTRFGDEDDVIQRKLQAANAAAAAAASAAAASASAAVKVPNGGGFHKKHDSKGGGSTFGRSRADEDDDENDEDGEVEHYDDDDGGDEGDEDDDDEADHRHGSRRRTEDSEYKSVDYAEESELGPTLDNFGAVNPGGSDGEALPFFLSEPQSTYVIRSRLAVLKCKAANALQVRHNFTKHNPQYMHFNQYCANTTLA